MRFLLPLAALIGFAFSIHYERDCPCTPSRLWLDIVVAIDTSIGMTKEGVAQVVADISTVFAETKIAQGEGHHSRLAVVTYGSKAEARYNLTDFKSTDEMMEAIWDVECTQDTVSNLKAALTSTQEVMKRGREGKIRQNVRSAIIIYASDFREGDVNDALQLAHQIKIGGTDIIVVAFDQSGKVNALEGLSKIASPGLFFRGSVNNVAGEIQAALCNANCFCKKQWMQYASDFEGSAVKYGECLRIGGIDANWMSAKIACQKLVDGGHLATELDDAKHNFIKTMFKMDYRLEPPYQYHIGLSYDKNKKAYFWEQAKGKERLALTESPFENWNSGFPNEKVNELCVLAVQKNTSQIGWQNENCFRMSKRYICQVDTCDTDNYCAIV